MGNRDHVEHVNVPKMTSIKETAEITGFPEFALRRLVKENKIVHIKSGNRAFINLEKFIEFLNNGEQGGGEANGGKK